MPEGQINEEAQQGNQGKDYLDLQWSRLTIVEKYVAIAYMRYLRQRGEKRVQFVGHQSEPGKRD